MQTSVDKPRARAYPLPRAGNRVPYRVLIVDDEDGVDAFLQKPVPLHELAQTLDRLLEPRP